MKPRVVILGAGFGGLELATSLSETLGDALAITLIDRADHFVFGYSKLDVMFGRLTADAVKVPYATLAKPGVTLLRETVLEIDPANRKVRTNAGTHEADFLVIALGADYDVSQTPGVTLGDNEFYSVSGATHLRDVLPTFDKGHAVVGICGAPYKCPPAPSECALMLHDFLEKRGVRGNCTITLVSPLPRPVPPSPETSTAILEAFAERGIEWVPNKRVTGVDRERNVIKLDDGTERPCDLFLGVPKQRAPDVVVAAGLTKDGWVTIDPRTLETSFSRVWAIGDLANTGAPKAGVFAEAAAKTVAANIASIVRDATPTATYPGAGSCYIELGADRIARVDVDFFSGPQPTGKFYSPSVELRADKDQFGASRRSRWFGWR
jgi:sulfide:quinone oxidoreductase